MTFRKFQSENLKIIGAVVKKNYSPRRPGDWDFFIPVLHSWQYVKCFEIKYNGLQVLTAASGKPVVA